MQARHDILDRRDSMRNPFAGSVALHAAVFVSAFVYSWLPISSVVQWGDPNSLGGGSVSITPVSKIPLPSRAGRKNPLANDTESQVPAPPPQQRRKRPAAAAVEPEAIPIQSRKPAKRTAPRAKPRSGALADVPRENQLYSEGGAAASSEMFGSTSGGGGVGVGAGNPFGNRFGYYVQILREKVAGAWNTNQVDPRLQTAPVVIVTFDIRRNGQAENVRFLQRSGHSTLDYSAQRAILDASPFPPLPEGFNRDTARIEFWFELKR